MGSKEGPFSVSTRVLGAGGPDAAVTAFSLEELTRTKPGIPNDPPMAIAGNLKRTAEKVEQARTIWGVPVRIVYGYRCPALNTACGSTSTTSAYLSGLAADTVPQGVALRGAWDAPVADPEFMQDIDQLIIERGCTHIGLRVAVHGFVARHELRQDRDINGEWHNPLSAPGSPMKLVLSKRARPGPFPDPLVTTSRSSRRQRLGGLAKRVTVRGR